MKPWHHLTFSLFLLALLFGSIFAAGTAVHPLSLLNAAPQNNLDLSLEFIADGLGLPTNMAQTGLPDDTRLFVVQQNGTIRIVTGTGRVLPTPFLDISSRTHLFGENGLLSLAFHPDYARNGFLFVYYTDKTSHNNHLSRFQVSPTDPNLADPNSEEILMTIVEPDEGHNGGDIKFGPDGYLYVPVGDGGLHDQNNPNPNPQDLSSPLGKILRVDVTQTSPHPPDCGSTLYTIPSDNPFVDGPGGACDEVWAYGLRNPWRISFDQLDDSLFIADVGENNWEEVNWQTASSGGGENYGWPCYEANAPYNLDGCAPPDAYIYPVFAYDHSAGSCSITGGYMYRGSRNPAMVGHYLLADFCSGTVWSLNQQNGIWQNNSYDLSLTFPTTFGQDSTGELYVLEHNGTLSHIVENTPLPALAVRKTGPTESAAGAPILYDIIVANSGSGPAANLLITDTIPSGANLHSIGQGGSESDGVVSWTAVSLAANSSITVTFAVTAAQTITNSTYGVSADGNLTAVGNNPVVTHIVAPHLTLQKTAPAIVSDGEPITYTLIVQNDGTLPASSVLLTDTIPLNSSLVATDGTVSGSQVSWQFGTVLAGEQKQGQLIVVPDVVGAILAIRNNRYGVAASNVPPLSGTAVVTILNGRQTFLPIIKTP